MARRSPSTSSATFTQHYNVDDDKKLRHFTPHEELDSWKQLQFYREDQYIYKGHAEQLAKMVNAGGKDVGSLEVGKMADLQVLDKNPLEDVKNTNTIRYVMKNGRLYDGNTLDAMWPRVKPVAPMWWWKEDPPVVKAAERP